MARRKIVSRRRIIIGGVVLVFLVAVILSAGQDLNLADPFAGGLDFRDRELSYSLFSLADVSKLKQFVAGTDQQIRDYKCYLKLHTSAELDDGNIIPLNSDFQIFGALTPFNVLTPQGKKIEEFRNIELRMRCDSIPKVGGGQHEFEVVPRQSNPLFVSIWGYNQNGKLVELKGIDLKPAFEFGGLAYTFNSQVEFLVNPTDRVKFANQPSVQDPLKPCCPPNNGLYTTSERTISKGVRISASDIESAIEQSSPLDPATFTTELQFRIHGAFDIDFPDLREEGVLAPRQIPVDQGLLINKMDVQITEPTGGEGFSLGATGESTITKVEPLNSKGQFVTDGSGTIKTMKVYVTLDNYDRNKEGSVKGTLIQKLDQSGATIATTGLGCGFPISISGIQSKFLCNFNVLQTTAVGEHTISIGTDSRDRINAIKSLLIVRSGAPVGGEDGCADGYVRDSLGTCRLFGTFGTGVGVQGCPPDQIKNSFGQCIIPTGEDSGGVVDPCPTQGEVRDEFGLCRPTTGTGGVGTKSCLDCSMNVIRTVDEEDMCPEFRCSDGTTVGDDQSIMNCDDKKPADIIAGEQTCNRIAGLLGGLLPILVDCEGEGRDANPERGEICAPAWVIGVFENLPLLIGVVIGLIIFIVIVGAILNRSPAGRAVKIARGALPKGF